MCVVEFGLKFPRSKRIFKKIKWEFCKKSISLDSVSSNDILYDTFEDKTDRPKDPNYQDLKSAAKEKLGNILKNYWCLTEDEPDNPIMKLWILWVNRSNFFYSYL